MADIAEICLSLKILAKTLKGPVILISQLPNASGEGSNRRPRLSDLDKCGSIEQEADLILFLYQDEATDRVSNDASTTEIIIGKQRNGPLGTIKLAFNPQINQFSNYVAST